LPFAILGAAREIHRERRALPEHALDVDSASEPGHQLLNDPEPQPHAPGVALGHSPLKALEDPGLILWSDADAVIPDSHHCLLRGGEEGELDGAALPVFRGVGKMEDADL
jgi:hypothetical protein